MTREQKVLSECAVEITLGVDNFGTIKVTHPEFTYTNNRNTNTVERTGDVPDVKFDDMFKHVISQYNTSVGRLKMVFDFKSSVSTLNASSIPGLHGIADTIEMKVEKIMDDQTDDDSLEAIRKIVVGQSGAFDYVVGNVHAKGVNTASMNSRDFFEQFNR